MCYSSPAYGRVDYKKVVITPPCFPRSKTPTIVFARFDSVFHAGGNDESNDQKRRQ